MEIYKVLVDKRPAECLLCPLNMAVGKLQHGFQMKDVNLKR